MPFKLKPTIYAITVAAPYRLSIVARPRGNDWLCDEVSALSREGIDTLVSMLTDGEANELGLQHESAECGAAGIKFVNVAMPDRSVPSDRNAFLRCVEQLADLVRGGGHVAVHCRASIGRASLLAASVLIRLGWDANAAFDAIQLARGCPVPDTEQQRRWVLSNVPTSDSPYLA
jgi:protein-tyrosine phosphatase